VRGRWAAVTNEALREAHIEARIDHRSLRAQGIDREPRPWIPKGAFEAERRGYYSPVAERMRADYQAREQARLEQSREPLAPGQAISSIPEEKAARPPSLEDVQRQSAEKWRRAREESAERPPENARSRGRDNDFSL
jgi:hypothetical protein